MILIWIIRDVSYLKVSVCLFEGYEGLGQSTEDLHFPLSLCIWAALDLSLKWPGSCCLSVCSSGVKLGKFPKLGNPGNESLIPPGPKIFLSSCLNLDSPKWFAKLGWWKARLVLPGLRTESDILRSDRREEKGGGGQEGGGGGSSSQGVESLLWVELLSHCSVLESLLSILTGMILSVVVVVWVVIVMGMILSCVLSPSIASLLSLLTEEISWLAELTGEKAGCVLAPARRESRRLGLSLSRSSVSNWLIRSAVLSLRRESHQPSVCHGLLVLWSLSWRSRSRSILMSLLVLQHHSCQHCSNIAATLQPLSSE